MGSHVATGSVVAGFRVEALIGEGATAVVYLAEEVDTGRRAALKVLSPELARDERFRRRFLREAQLAASLDHAHVVPTIAAGEADSGVLFLAMAYVEGSDLRTMLQRETRLAPERAVALVGQVAEALDAAHATGLIHRDVKPGNILVASDPDGERAYVCDFGLARHVSSVSSLTGDRGFVGTIDYVPPEQIEGAALDARADVYSLGCVLFEALTGSRPFERESELSVVFAHLNEPPPSVADLQPELPPAFDDVFRTALAKKPADRYPTCGELARAARAALQGRSVQSRRLRRRRILVGAAVAAGAATIAIATLVATETGSSSRHPNQPPIVVTRGPPKITQRAIGGVVLGHPRSYYQARLHGFKPSVLGGTNYPTMSFQQPELAVYFPAPGKPAHIITTWNRQYRTAAGIGPCSTLAEMEKAYGKRVQPAWAGTSPNGKRHVSWTLGRNLLFETQDQRTISSVVLFRGVAHENHPRSPQTYANYVGANETACK